MNLKLFTFCTLTFVLFSANFFSQVDFNNFKNLKAEGEIPTDFKNYAFDKIKDDLSKNKVDLKGKNEKLFLEGVHYAINDLLHSGMVVYGDEVSNYVSKIADKLLEKDQDLRSKLRFYTIKTNETNAFSTYQGIIFVTTGLISQLTNEAQLAYVLSHEIAHYTEEHVVQTFDLNSKTNNTDKIQKLSSFSKENEFEADKLGVKLYYEAGYNKKDLLSTFDVLLYSYLPFEEIEFPINYFNSELMTIPEGFFPKEKFSIKAIEDTDDSRSSHPNIKKRKEAVLKELDNYKNWQSKDYIISENNFLNIRDLCRFESVRTDIVNAEFDDALYSIFILEKKYPNSIYLKRMKAKAWLGIAQYKSTGDLSKKLPKTKELEGEIAFLQYFIKNLNKNQAITVSMRNIEDLRKENPNDEFIKGVWGKMIKTFGQHEKYDLIKFSKKSYKSVYDEFVLKNSDTTKLKKEKIEEENLSKYDKIKNQKNSEKNINVFDTSSFYLYAISDLLELKLFQEKFEELKQDKKKKEKEKEDYESLSYKEKKKYHKNLESESKNIDLKSFIYLEPLVFSYENNKINKVKSEKLQIDYTNSVMEISQEMNLDIDVLSTSNLQNKGTETFNQRSVLMSYFSELTDNSEIEVFPTDYSSLLEIKEKTGSNLVMLSILEHENKSRLQPIPFVFTMIVYPTFFIYVTSSFMHRNRVNYSYLVFDITKGSISYSRNFQTHEPLNRTTVKARLYETFQTIKYQKAN
jgi:beta-barrel assembly-enhancing protease